MDRIEKIKKDFREGFGRSVSRDAAHEIRGQDLHWAVGEIEQLKLDLAELLEERKNYVGDSGFGTRWRRLWRQTAKSGMGDNH